VQAARRREGTPSAGVPRAVVWAGLAVVLLAYGWWVTELRPFSWPVLLAVESAGVAAITVGLWRRRRSGAVGAAVPGAAPARPRRPEGLAVWVGLLALLAAWQMQAYLQQPRSEHPTISLMIDGALDTQPARVVAFAAWVVAGYGLARR
jgi:hypothetical protein